MKKSIFLALIFSQSCLASPYIKLGGGVGKISDFEKHKYHIANKEHYSFLAALGFKISESYRVDVQYQTYSHTTPYITTPGFSGAKFNISTAFVNNYIDVVSINGATFFGGFGLGTSNAKLQYNNLQTSTSTHTRKGFRKSYRVFTGCSFVVNDYLNLDIEYNFNNLNKIPGYSYKVKISDMILSLRYKL